jgi:fibronectin-binding autotransporter adhesin
VPSSNFTVSSTISDATLSTGALDANGTFTGLNGYSIGGLTIQPHLPGFVMHLGNTVTLSGSNTYTGGTTLLAGTLVANSDGALGAAPTGRAIDPNTSTGWAATS